MRRERAMGIMSRFGTCERLQLQSHARLRPVCKRHSQRVTKKLSSASESILFEVISFFNFRVLEVCH